MRKLTMLHGFLQGNLFDTKNIMRVVFPTDILAKVIRNKTKKHRKLRNSINLTTKHNKPTLNLVAPYTTRANIRRIATLAAHTSECYGTYKLATVCFKARSTSTPAYLQSLLVPHVPSRPLRSSHAPRLAVPRTVLPAVLSLPLHRPFGNHCRTMSSTRTPWQITFFTATYEMFLPPSASACLIMALYKFLSFIHSFIRKKDNTTHNTSTTESPAVQKHYVFIRLQKAGTDGADMTCYGSSVQVLYSFSLCACACASLEPKISQSHT